MVELKLYTFKLFLKWIENDSNADNITVEFLNLICKSLD